MSFSKIFYYVNIIWLIGTGLACAQTIIAPNASDNGSVTLQVNSFQDQTEANSVMQAQQQFVKLKTQSHPVSILDFGHDEGSYWFDIHVTNNSRVQKWYLELPSALNNSISPVKTISVYDAAQPDKPIAQWPDLQKKSFGRMSLPLNLPYGQTTTLYALVDTWSGINNQIVPTLKAPEQVDSDDIDLAQKISLLWLIMGAVSGAGLVQLVLTRRPVQGMLALNALILAFGMFLLKRPELIPGITAYHPAMLPLCVYGLIGTAASFMLWIVSSPYTSRATWNILPIILNIGTISLTWLKLDTIISNGLTLEMLPNFLMTATGLLLLIVTLASGIVEVGLMWFAPAWLALAAMPWLSSTYPFATPIVYASLLGLAGVSSVFSYWKTMDRETESLQKRLRQELRNIKTQYSEESKIWERKIENERAVLNELRHREQQRSAELDIARKDADSANKAKSDFLAIISHEIRTPMTGIMGVVDLMRHTPMNTEQREYVDVIKNSGDTMVTLLNDILDYSKIEKGAIDIEYIPFALRVLVRSVATLMSGRAKEKGLQIIVDINDDIPDNFQGDPNRLRQVLLNLVGNAIKFTQSGHITIKVSSDAVSNASITLRFDIIDTGIGISIDAQSQLFKPYAQADASISRRFGGTGLGLNICRMLVTAMKGSIGLESTEGRGSDFWFTLPLTIEEAIDPASPEILENTAPQRALNVLLIDDNVVNLKVTAGLMEKEGHHVITADSGQKALDLLVQNHFDVVFVDMLMPDMDGKEFIGKMRENPALGKLPVFALTGMSDKESQQKMMRLSVQDVFTKPVSRQTLQKALNKIAAIPEPIKELSAEDILSKIHELPADQQKLILQALKIEAPVVLSPPPVVTPSPVAPAPVAVPVPEQPAPVYTPPPPVPVVKPAIVEELPPVKATRKTEDTVTHIHADPAVEEEPEYEEEPEITPEPEETVEPMPEYELEQKPEPKQKKEPEIINLVMLADLKNSLPPETFKEIFDELIDKAKELMQLIQEALRDEDMDDLTEKAHNLKGMAGNFGLTYLMKYAAELENYGRHYEKEKAAKMIPISRPVLDKTLTALEQWIKTH